MIQVTFTFNTIAAAVAALAKIPEADAAMGTVTSVSAEEKAAVVPKGKPSAAPTAPSQPTAGAAPSPPAPSAAAPAPALTATPPSADAPSAPADAFDYAVLQRAVNAAVPKHGKDKLLAIAKAHGAENFKGLPANAWAAAHADVVALG